MLNKKLSLIIAAILLVLPLLGIGCVDTIEYDVVILNGRVMDPETNFDGVRNVGIKDGTIVTITEDKISGKETIDVKDHVVAPGFIDTHVHGHSGHSYKMYVRDGMTSAMDLECGSLQIGKFYDDRDGKALINYGTGVSHEFARIAVMDGVIGTESTFLYVTRSESALDGYKSWDQDLPTEDQLKDIYEWIRRGLDEGGLMVCSMPGYIRDVCTTKEIWEIQKIAAEYRRGFACHPRFGPFEKPPTEYPLGYKEVIANASVLNQPILLSHNNNQGWEEVVEMTVRGRENGMIIWSEQYPYIAGGPNAGNNIVAPENLKAMGFEVNEVMYDPEIGRFLEEDEFIEMRKTNPAKNLVGFLRPKDWPAKWVATQNMSIVNDAFSLFLEDGVTLAPIEAPFEDYVGHPRAAGTRGKCLRLARENNVSLMLVINNASTFPAKMLAASGIKDMERRGKIQEGMIADITIFNPKTVTENSSYDKGKNGLPTTGIPYVIINGKIVVRDSMVDLNVRAGQPIRHEVINR